MALILKDRVKETTAVTSTGTATLLGAVTGYQSFSAIGNGNTCYYTIAAQTTNEWEVGIGTYTSPDQLSRDTVLSSSNSGSLVNFSAGTKDVFVTQPSSKAVYTDASNIVNTSGNGANTVAFTNINASNVVMVSGTISTNAANATDITNKTYVDNLFSTGITYHDPVLVESPIALNALYNQPGGAGNGVGATLTNNGANAALVVDGVTLSNTARVLVYQQSNAVQNGVYTVTNPGNVSAQWVLTRATDADTYGVGDPNKLGQGDAFFVQSGNTGAGETYILNTVGTITFGTTNLTFAQISSAQVYSAGTGLNLTNLAFSISNTAVTAAQYGNDGAVGQFTVNAQGQITNAANVSINASSISVGTLANGRTTAASANGASTIVSRDTNGSFAANVITATTVNATSGNFTNITANASGLTDINASNITSGTISNARTTASDANGASTIVTRDANGAFSAGNVTAANFIGAGATITSINASNISSGTIANARTTAASANGASTIVSRDSGGNFSANTVTAAVIGDISGGSNINASNISSGTIANARTTASASNGASTIVLRDAGGAFAAGAITGTSFTGNGSAITAINASSISSGTLDNARTNATSANGASTLVVRDANGSFAGNVITGTTGTFTNLSGNGSSLTAINASNISSGTIANARTTAATANGASTIVLRGTSGEFSAGIITADGSGLSAINASNISSGTVASARISGSYTGITGVGTLTAGTWNANVIANAYTSAASANGASTIVLRDSTGSFTANVGTFTTVSGAGGGLTSINASNISSGTVATARLGSGTANASTFLRGDQTYAVPASGVTITNDTSTNATYYPIFTTASTGSISAANVSTTELTFNPGTNILSAPVVSSSYGFSMNPATLSTSFTIPASFNAVSAGPVTLANGVTITVSTGSAWVVV
jgi:trimeric autotransporter adhesin